MQRQNARHFVLVVGVDVVVDGVAGELHLAEAQVRGGRLGNVHDFAVRRHNEYEAVERLQQMRTKLFDCRHSCVGRHIPGTPRFAETCQRSRRGEIEEQNEASLRKIAKKPDKSSEKSGVQLNFGDI